jgi:predicted ATPase
MIIEDKHVEKTSKMTDIINELKSNSKYINKDENYPTININHIIQIKQKENNKINRIINKIKKLNQKKLLILKKLF